VRRHVYWNIGSTVRSKKCCQRRCCWRQSTSDGRVEIDWCCHWHSADICSSYAGDAQSLQLSCIGSVTNTPSTKTRCGEFTSVQYRWCTPRLLQRNPIWSNYETLLKLQRVQNSLARVILQQSTRSHAEPLLRTLHWLPVKQRIHYKLATLTCKIRATSVRRTTYVVWFQLVPRGPYRCHGRLIHSWR